MGKASENLITFPEIDSPKFVFSPKIVNFSKCSNLTIKSYSGLEIFPENNSPPIPIIMMIVIMILMIIVILYLIVIIVLTT